MRLIAITPEEDVANEHNYVSLLIAEGFIVHCRKPGKKAVDLAAYLRNIAPEFRNAIAIHDHHELADDMGIKRLHFTEEKRKEAKISKDRYHGYQLSTSLHDRKTVSSLKMEAFSYIFCGPVYDSISKPGYEGQQQWRSAFEGSSPFEKIAIGGITPEKMGEISKLGYDGAAFSGYLWKNPEKINDRITRIKDVWLKDLTY